MWLSWKSFSVRHICIFWFLNSLFHLPFLFFPLIDLLVFSVIKHISRTLVFCDWIANVLFPVYQVSFDFSLVSYTMQKFLFDLVEFINLFFFQLWLVDCEAGLEKPFLLWDYELFSFYRIITILHLYISLQNIFIWFATDQFCKIDWAFRYIVWHCLPFVKAWEKKKL